MTASNGEESPDIVSPVSKRKPGLDRKSKKRKERERRLRRERNLRRHRPVPIEDLPEGEPEAEEEEAAERGRRARTPFSPFDMERVLRRIVVVKRKTIEAGDAAGLDPKRFVGKRIDEIAAEIGEDEPREHAQELAYRAMEAFPAKQAEVLAREAIALDPDCSDALAILALTGDAAERIAGLQTALAAAERSLGGTEFPAGEADLESNILVRPYLRVRATLADLLRLEDRSDEASAHYRALLELDPSDHRGVHHALIALELRRGALASAREWLERYSRDVSSIILWERVLERFLSDDRKGAARAAVQARRRNLFVERAMFDRMRLDEDEPDEAEAKEVFHLLGPVLLERRDLLRWILEGGRATTEEEREQAIVSYVPPVSRLLSLGQPDSGPGWAGEPIEGLGPEHVSELVRMACDPALYECNEGSTEACAPVHAWRALARLRAPEAVEPLVGLLRQRFDDDCLGADAIWIFSALGAPSVPALRSLLVDETADEDARLLASEVLQRIGERDASVRQTCVAAILAALARFEENTRYFNARLIGSLVWLKAIIAAPTIEKAYRASCVDEDLVGDWEEVRAELGVASE